MNSRKTKKPLTSAVGGSNKLTAFWREKNLRKISDR